MATTRVSQNEQLTNPNGLRIANAAFLCAPTAARLQQIPDGSGVAVFTAATATLTNKTLIAASNNVAANALVSSNTVLRSAGSAPPIAGQYFTYTSGASPLVWAPGTLPGTTLYTGTGSTSGSEGVTLFQVPVSTSQVAFVRADVAVRSSGAPTNSSGYRVEATFRRGPTTAASDSNMIVGGSQNNAYTILATNPAVDAQNYPQFRLDSNNNNAPILFGFSSSTFGAALWKYSVEVLLV